MNLNPLAKKNIRLKSQSQRIATRSRRLCLEGLEERLAMDGSATGTSSVLPWNSLGTLTYSFAQEGSAFGDSRSSLFSSLSESGTEEQWKVAFQHAFEAWLRPLGASITEVADTGAAFGSFGPTQNDARFGDVRIGAVPLSTNILAEAIPHSMLVQGSWAGDILLNSNLHWTSTQQVFEVAMHEFGHVLGLKHSVDVNSAMYIGGVHPLASPSTDDIAALKLMYTGLSVETENHSSNLSESEPLTSWIEPTEFPFDPTLAIDLSPIAATSTRYQSSGELTTASPRTIYKLVPIGEIDHATFLNVVVSAKDQNGLIPKVVLYDESGDKVSFKILNNSSGILTLQASDVEANHTYYLAVSAAAAPAIHQVGKFDLLAEYGIASLDATKLGTFSFGGSIPVVEYDLSVNTTRLFHWMIKVDKNVKDTAKLPIAVWGTIVDGNNAVVSQIALRPGDTRSAPLVLLIPGEYRVLMQTGTQNPNVTPNVTATLYVDEISVDVGATVVDPSNQPMIACDTPGSNPTTCVGTPPIVINGPVYPLPPSNPPTASPLSTPWMNPTWYYWPTTALPLIRHNAAMALDVTGDTVISPIDALVLVNTINQGLTEFNTTPTYLDTNNDGVLSPLDILLVINYLNSKSGSGLGEGESTAPEMMFDWYDTDASVSIATTDRSAVKFGPIRSRYR